jgi:hypothetical protein
LVLTHRGGGSGAKRRKKDESSKKAVSGMIYCGGHLLSPEFSRAGSAQQIVLVAIERRFSQLVLLAIYDRDDLVSASHKENDNNCELWAAV